MRPEVISNEAPGSVRIEVTPGVVSVIGFVSPSVEPSEPDSGDGCCADGVVPVGLMVIIRGGVESVCPPCGDVVGNGIGSGATWAWDLIGGPLADEMRTHNIGKNRPSHRFDWKTDQYSARAL